jgi:hypothetical protein
MGSCTSGIPEALGPGLSGAIRGHTARIGTPTFEPSAFVPPSLGMYPERIYH